MTSLGGRPQRPVRVPQELTRQQYDVGRALGEDLLGLLGLGDHPDRAGRNPALGADHTAHDARHGHFEVGREIVWSAELQNFVRDGNMPQLELMWLPMDHLAGGRPGMCTPRA